MFYGFHGYPCKLLLGDTIARFVRQLVLLTGELKGGGEGEATGRALYRPTKYFHTNWVFCKLFKNIEGIFVV